MFWLVFLLPLMRLQLALEQVGIIGVHYTQTSKKASCCRVEKPWALMSARSSGYRLRFLKERGSLWEAKYSHYNIHNCLSHHSICKQIAQLTVSSSRISVGWAGMCGACVENLAPKMQNDGKPSKVCMAVLFFFSVFAKDFKPALEVLASALSDLQKNKVRFCAFALSVLLYSIEIMRREDCSLETKILTLG